MPNSKSSGSLFLACILAAYAVLGLLVFVPDLMAGATTLVLVVLVIVVIVVVLFAAAIILKGLARLLVSFRH
ncbi:hypothetical protein [Sporosarcina sp. G11-34]|uniref:hypothetical protein n=1 Tax=Sporosarcina sp. G11-34 TaxID=2849605 RepID=UPI0022A95EDB|nr:hypothetical protein [Sporosarcina sp. G11-34]MCZ2258525.1 hypothetical protein [Sporosarcina sp. G11-34]